MGMDLWAAVLSEAKKHHLSPASPDGAQAMADGLLGAGSSPLESAPGEERAAFRKEHASSSEGALFGRASERRRSRRASTRTHASIFAGAEH